MKYFLTLFLVTTLAITAHSQWWFDAGLKGAFGPTLMYDQNVFDHGSYKHKISTGGSFGARLGFNNGYHNSISLEYNLATSKQDFNLNSVLYNSFKWKHNDFALIIRHSGDGAFIEIGGKLSSISRVELDNVNQPIRDVSENFKDTYTSGILGFGSYLAGNDLVTLNMGIRLHWAFTDMVSEAGKEMQYPIIVDNLDDPSRKTLATAAQLQVELNYAFGRFAKTACSNRWKLLLFQ